jgi:glycosyltransferase involved in cell wall biosynthesis
VLVSPRSEGVNTPLKIYSYLASGVATLATRIPAHTQVLTEDCALLVEPNAEALGAGLERLLGDEALRVRLGEHARSHAEEHYSRRAFTEKLARFYRLLEERLHADGRSGGGGARAEEAGRARDAA